MCKLDLPEPKRLSCFLGGLKTEIATGVKLLRPQSVLEAIKLARLQESNLDSIQRLTLNSNGGKLGFPSSSRGLLPTPVPLITNTNHSSASMPRDMKKPIHFDVKPSYNPAKGVLGRPNLSFRQKMTEEELEECRVKNLCYYCRERYSPGHDCKQKKRLQIFMMEVMDDDQEVEEKLEACNSSGEA